MINVYNRLDNGSKVYMGNLKLEGCMSVSLSVARALHGPKVSDFPYTPRESIV